MMDEKIKQLIELVNSIDDSHLRIEKDFSFQAVQDEIETVKEFASKVSDRWWSQLPEVKQTAAVSAAEQYTLKLVELRDFDPTNEQGEFPQKRADSIMQHLKSRYNKLYEYLITPIQVFIGYADTNKEELLKREEEIDKMLRRLEGASDVISPAATEKASEENYAQFNNQARTHAWIAVIFLTVSIFIGIVIFCLGAETIGAVEKLTGDSSETRIVFTYLARAIPSAVLFVFLYQTLKNFNVHSHLYSVNKHRANSLKVFQGYYFGSKSEVIGNVFLENVARTVFEPIDTGFLKSQKDLSTDITTILPRNLK